MKAVQMNELIVKLEQILAQTKYKMSSMSYNDRYYMFFAGKADALIKSIETIKEMEYNNK